MEGYLEIFGRKFCGKKEISGYGEGNYFLGSGNTGSVIFYINKTRITRRFQK
jgi:hypothetical protein